jgi:hypothetical protein
VGTVVSIQLLSRGIDTLYWSTACGIDAERFAALRAARDRAGEHVDPAREIGGYALTVEPHGAGRYPVLVTCAEFSVQLTDSEHIPTAFVQLRSEFLHSAEGPEAAFAQSMKVVASLCGRDVSEPHASRLDVYADWAGWVLRDEDRRGLVTHAKLYPVLRAGTDDYETIRVGTSPMVLRLYRKDIELRTKPGFADVFWGGYAGPVVRVEAQALTEKLRELGIVTVADALASYGDLWAYATRQFCELRAVGAGDREAWPLREEWRAVQSLGVDVFPRSGLVPFVQAARDKKRVARVLLGALKTYAAMEGVEEPLRALARLRAEYPGFVTDDRQSFVDAVRVRRARLAKAVREAEPVA